MLFPLTSVQKSLQNLQDASDDLMMLEDDALLIPYQIGDVFVSHTQEETQEMLEAAKVGCPAVCFPWYRVTSRVNIHVTFSQQCHCLTFVLATQ